MKWTAPLILFMLLAKNNFAAPAWVVLKGNIDGKLNGKTIFIKRIPSSWKDSVVIQNGKFEFRKEFIAPCCYLLYTEENMLPFELLVEHPGVIAIDAGKDGLERSRIKGSFAQTIYAQFLAERRKLLDEKNAAAQKATEKPAGDMQRALLAENVLEVADDITAPLALSYALKYPATFAAAYILEGYGDKQALTGIEYAYYRFSKPVQESYAGQRLKMWLQKLESDGPGKTVADFSLVDASGKTVRFSDIKNKVVLVNFWASWCGPCREEFKSLRYLYEKHKDKGFAIVSISVDVSPTAWKKALQQEQLQWLQLRDETTGVDISGGRFGVTALPTTFLLDKNRKVLYRDLSTGVMDKVIEGLLNE